MSPESASPSDLTHQGIWGIWTGQLALPTAAQSSSTSGRARSTAPSGSKTREPIRENSRAWESLKSQAQPSQNLTPSSGGTTPGSVVPGFRPRTMSSTSRAGRLGSVGASTVSRAPVPTDEHIAAVANLYQAKGGSGGRAGKGKQVLPSGERTACRRGILALCEQEPYAAQAWSDQRLRQAAWAYFANEEEEAVRILLESSGRLLDMGMEPKSRADALDTQHRLIGATLATSLIRSGSNRKPNREEWISVIEGMDDPYIRAVLRRVGGDSWETVLREGGKEGLDLVDRVIIAVNNLNDNDVSNGTQRRGYGLIHPVI